MKHPRKKIHTLKFDLEERTAAFGEATIDFCLTVPVNPVTAPLISQYVRSVTSIAANYGEANDAESRKDFCHKIALCRKEAKESMLWPRMITRAAPAFADPARTLWKEASELNKIFSTILKSTRRNDPTDGD